MRHVSGGVAGAVVGYSGWDECEPGSYGVGAGAVVDCAGGWGGGVFGAGGCGCGCAERDGDVAVSGWVVVGWACGDDGEFESELHCWGDDPEPGRLIAEQCGDGGDP